MLKLCLIWLSLLGQVDENIAKLGSDSFDEREKATKVLEEMGHKVLPRLELEAYNNPDYEIRLRCQRIIASYYEITYTDIPSIWSLPQAYRIQNNCDLAHLYYNEVRNFYNRNNIEQIHEHNWNNEWCKYQAMCLFLFDQLNKKHDKNFIQEIKNECVDKELREKMLEDIRLYGLKRYIPMIYDSPIPPPIDVRICNLRYLISNEVELNGYGEVKIQSIECLDEDCF